MEAEGRDRMGVEVISVEKIKPTLIIRGGEKVDQGFNLCLIDQLMMRSYFGIVIFYPPPPPSATFNNNNLGKQLKATLSTALNTFYPLSGRVKGNLTVDDFQAGVPFTETRVKGYNSLSDFLKSPDLEFLNHLSPVETFALTTTYDEPQPPPLVVKLNLFPCGGVALGLGFNHKLVDGATADAFLNTWANARHDHHGLHLISSKASSVFPPRQSIPAQLAYVADESYHRNRKTSTKRFVFDSNSIAALKSSGTSSQIQNPSRTEAVLAFIWKSIMAASAPTPTLSPQLLVLGVNLRSRMKKLSSSSNDKHSFSFGNLVSMAGALSPDDAADREMDHLLQLIRTGIVSMDENYLNFISSSTEEAFQAMMEGLEKFRELGSQLLTTSSWIRFCFSDADFGFGKPVWTGVLGEATAHHPTYNNLVILTELLTDPNKAEHSTAVRGIEAWIRLDVQVMNLLEQNSNFLQFASLNPPVLF